MDELATPSVPHSGGCFDTAKTDVSGLLETGLERLELVDWGPVGKQDVQFNVRKAMRFRQSAVTPYQTKQRGRHKHKAQSPFLIPRR